MPIPAGPYPDDARQTIDSRDERAYGPGQRPGLDRHRPEGPEGQGVENDDPGKPESPSPVPGATIAELGDGLRLRHARPEDAGALATLNGDVHRNIGDAGPDERAAAWTRDLLLKPHPTVTPAHTLLVEDTATGAIASTLVLIPQTWSYGGISFGVGRIELVSTAVPYRRRGLVRRQMEEVHRWSAASGDLAQAITGIPWYYRQFGYEMTLDLGGERQVLLSPTTLDDGSGPALTRVRAATVTDIPALLTIDEHAGRRGLFSCRRDVAAWRYQLAGPPAVAVDAWDIRVITAAGGDLAGYLVADGPPSADGVTIIRLEIGPATTWVDAVGPTLAWATAGARAAIGATPAADPALRFVLGSDHPAYALLTGRVIRPRRRSAWFLRIADVPGFLWRFRPVLEANLAASPAADFSGDLTVSSYREGFILRLRSGAIEAVEPWPEPDATASARFPGLTFLQLLSGWRDLDHLEDAFPDCLVRNEHRAVIEGLFPRRGSWVWPLD